MVFSLYLEGVSVKNYLPEIIAALLLALAVFGLVHQQMTSNDVWFHLRQLRNHETIVSCLIAAAIALLTGKYLERWSQR